MRINGRVYEIVGVMPPSFIFPTAREQVWVPIAFNEQDAARTSQSFFAAARLKDAVGFEAARGELDAIGRQLAAEYPDANRDETAGMTPMADFGVQPMKGMLYALLGIVGLVLLIACVNVANLLLAQAGGRQREFAIRTALGAARTRLVSQVLAEGLVLALAGGAVGLFVAHVAHVLLADLLPPPIRMAPFRPVGSGPAEGAVLAFALLASLACGAIFSVAPALASARTAPGASLRTTGGRGGTARFTRFRSVLVALEVALAVVVLAAAGLMIKSVSRLAAVDAGVATTNVLLMELALPQEDFYGPPTRVSFCRDLAREVSTIPGVETVGAISHLPLSGANAGRGLTIEGWTPPPDSGASASYRLTCPGYFAALGIPLVRGRDFTDADATTAPGVAIVNDTMAEAYWPGQEPLGKRLKLGRPDSSNPWLTVVGVARDVRHFGLDSQPRREFFRPYSQAAWPQMTVVARVTRDPVSFAGAVRSALRTIEPDEPVTQIRTMEDVATDSMGPRRFPMLLLSLFSAVALLLAVVGVYGVVSYVVSQRRREIGIRVALGAKRAQVIGMVVRQSLLPIGAGIAVGLGLAAGVSRSLEAMLFGVTPQDATVRVATVGILAASGIAACLVPARRAAMVDPLVVLKEE